MAPLWRTRTRSTQLDEGRFVCPSEGEERAYRLQRARREKTVVGIPVGSSTVLGEFVECLSCGELHPTSVLEPPPSVDVAALLPLAMRHIVVAILGDVDPLTKAQRDVALRVMAESGDDHYLLFDLERDLGELDGADVAPHLRSVAPGLTPNERDHVVRAAARLASAGGDVDMEALDTIAAVGDAVGLRPAEVKRLLDDVVAGPRI